MNKSKFRDFSATREDQVVRVIKTLFGSYDLENIRKHVLLEKASVRLRTLEEKEQLPCSGRSWGSACRQCLKPPQLPSKLDPCFEDYPQFSCCFIQTKGVIMLMMSHCSRRASDTLECNRGKRKAVGLNVFIYSSLFQM